jgi:hypothetical protein
VVWLFSYLDSSNEYISSNIYFLSLSDNAHRPYIITAIKIKMNGEIEAAHTAAHEPKSL